MYRQLKSWWSPLAVTLLLVILIAVASFVVTERINQAEEEAGFTRLSQEAEELTHNIEQIVQSDREKLTLIAKIMADNPGEMEKYLQLYRDTGSFFSKLELLLPGNLLVTTDGERLDATGKLSFAEEAAKGVHISDREQSMDGTDYEVRHFMPVKCGEETVAMLCGVVELSSVQQKLPYEPYGGQAAVYIIDGTTGDFLIDTWHTGQPLGNIWALGGRPLANGYDEQQLRTGLVEGDSNFIVFVSNTTKEYLYFYYTPLQINQWRVALSVPEDLVFAEARSIRNLLNLFLLVESIAFVFYIGWLIFYVRRETGEKQRQLDALNRIYDVEKLLFNAHEHQENVPRSLEAIARMLPAARVAFLLYKGEGDSISYLWDEGGETAQGAALLDSTAALVPYFAQGNTEICAQNVVELRAVMPTVPDGMTNLVAIPIQNAAGRLRGILAASGLSCPSCCTAMLRSVGFSYAMLSENTYTYQEMQRQGTVDTLTGLYNRNRYEQDLTHIAGDCRTGLCCIYIDVNGLHELNNSQGHQAGDHMLQTVAHALQHELSDQLAYRIGGDEFVVFAVDADQDEMRRRSEVIAASLEQQGYHISVGIEYAEAPVEDLTGLVKSAEKQMYDAKRAYYQSREHDRRAR